MAVRIRVYPQGHFAGQYHPRDHVDWRPWEPGVPNHRALRRRRRVTNRLIRQHAQQVQQQLLMNQQALANWYAMAWRFPVVGYPTVPAWGGVPYGMQGAMVAPGMIAAGNIHFGW